MRDGDLLLVKGMPVAEVVRHFDVTTGIRVPRPARHSGREEPQDEAAAHDCLPPRLRSWRRRRAPPHQVGFRATHLRRARAVVAEAPRPRT